MIGQTFPKVFNNDEGYSSWNTPFLIIIKKEGHLSKELWQLFSIRKSSELERWEGG